MKAGVAVVGWGIAGAVVLFALMSVVLHYQPRQGIAGQLASEAKKLELIGGARSAITSAAEAEKSAVLSTTDEDSARFAGESRAATALASQRLRTLSEELRTSGTASDLATMSQLTSAFTELEQVDARLLELAVQNTNLKATALSFGPGTVALAALDQSLLRIVEAAAKLSDAGKGRQIILLATTAQAAALRIQCLLPVHIAEESDTKMDALESRLNRSDQEIRASLTALRAASGSEPSQIEAATASYERFAGLTSTIVLLSRRNTNVRSLSLSLNEKRKVLAACLDALAALEKGIEDTRRARAEAGRGRAR